MEGICASSGAGRLLLLTVMLPFMALGRQADWLAWYDAADSTTVVLTNNKVACWKDKSGNGHDLSAVKAGNLPEFTDGVVSVHGGQTLLAQGVSGVVTQMTVYAVVRCAPGNMPLVSFRADTISEFCAAGWTVGAKPSLFTSAGSVGADGEVEDSQWHLLTFVRDGAVRRFYIDGIPAGEKSASGAASEMTDLLLFAYSTAGYFSGSMAELRISLSAHDSARVDSENRELLKKWARLFTDPENTLVVFVGNSLTTGMYCGNGRTWSAFSAQRAGLTHWVNVSRGGITTPQLTTLAESSIDPIRKRTRGRAILVLWEGTNDIAVNKVSGVEAAENIAAFCAARKMAGWDKIVVLTGSPRAAPPEFEKARRELNDLLKKDYAKYQIDAVVELEGDPAIGSAGAQNNKAFYADQVHLTEAGNRRVADLVAKVLVKYGGPPEK